jgi:transmembrane sensor
MNSMMNPSEAEWNLIVNCLSDEATAADHAKLQEWISLSEENKRFYQETATLWNQLSLNEETQSFDASKAWNNVNNQIINTENTNSRFSDRRYSLFSLSRVAAILLIFVVIGITGILLFNHYKESTNKELITSVSSEKQEIQLSDGSRITLNRQSELIYPNKFKRNERIVSLKGEAYFEISHDASHPFVINTKLAKIKVLGTSFNVKCNEKEGLIEVLVESGKVQVSNLAGDSSILVDKGYKAVYDLQNKKFSLYTSFNINELAWKTNLLVFKKERLAVVANKLDELYGTHHNFSNNEIEELKLSATFIKQPIDSILRIIEMTFSIKITKNGNNIEFANSHN